MLNSSEYFIIVIHGLFPAVGVPHVVLIIFKSRGTGTNHYFCSMNNFRPGGFQQLPVVVKNIIIINVLVFLLEQLLDSRGMGIDNMFALHYWHSPLFKWWQLFTHMFMHGSLAHLFFNMFAFWMFGNILENVWGPGRFILFYFVCGMGAALCHLGVLGFQFSGFHNQFMAFQQSPSYENFAYFISQHHIGVNPQFLTNWAQNPGCTTCVEEAVRGINTYYAGMIDEATVGASGAVFGILFAFGYLFPNTELFIYFIPIPIKAKWVVGAYALLELVQGVANSSGDNIAHFAHLGGMLFAFILLRIWGKNIRNNFY